MTVYFAYGANMDPVHMTECCPGAQQLGVAELRGHRFGIGAGGFGTVRPVEGCTVFGVLWLLTPADLTALDRFEGVAENVYRRDRAIVSTATGPVDAMIYRPTDDCPGTPSPGYLERIVQVAEMLTLSPQYIASLRNLISQQPVADN